MLKRKQPMKRTPLRRTHVKNLNARSSLRRESPKRVRRNREARPTRDALKAKHTACMICGHSPENPWRDKPADYSRLVVHEVANGVDRDKALDKPYACLVLCSYCNLYEVVNKAKWPEARQLAVLLAKAPEDYDLEAYNALVNPRAPNRITQKEVNDETK